MVKTRKDVRVREVAASRTENLVLSHRKPCQLSLTSSISTSGFSVLVFLRHWISFPGMAPTYVRLHNRPPPSVSHANIMCGLPHLHHDPKLNSPIMCEQPYQHRPKPNSPVITGLPHPHHHPKPKQPFIIGLPQLHHYPKQNSPS